MEINLIDSRSSFIQGIFLGMIFDNKLTNLEIESFIGILRDCPDLVQAEVLNPHKKLLGSILKRDYIIRGEYNDLKAMIYDILGIPQPTENVNLLDSIPFDQVSSIQFERRLFVVTGQFEMNRQNVENYIIQMGGEVKEACTSKVNYIIVGSKGDPAWKFGKYGTKIDAAVKLKQGGREILILSEQLFKTLINDSNFSKQEPENTTFMTMSKGRGRGGIILTKMT